MATATYYMVIRNERTESRERRDGSRIQDRRVLTWDVVRDGTLYRECRTKKEAVRECNRLNATLPVVAGRRVVTAVRLARPRI